MKVKVLGCSGGIGGKHLRTTSLRVDNDVLIDAGTGVTDLSLTELSMIDHILLTHSHLDHIATIPFIVDTVGAMRDKPITIYAIEETLETLKKHIFNWSVWPDFTAIPSADKPFMRYEVIKVGQTLVLDNRRFTVLPANHTVPAVGYQINSGKASLVFTGDTFTNDPLWAVVNKIPNLKHLIIETAFCNREKQLAVASKHLCPSLLAEELAKLERSAEIFITHLKPGEIELTMQEIEEYAGDYKPRMLQNGQISTFEPMSDTTVSTAMLQGFEPLSSLSAARLKEFAGLCYLEQVSRGLDPFRVKSAADQLAFLATGELEISFAGGGSETVAAGTPSARAALVRPQPIAAAKALTDVELIRIDRDLLDIMMTWDQLAAFDATRTGRFKTLPSADSEPLPSNWNVMSGVFSVTNLKTGAFANLPSAHIGELLNRFARVEVKAGEVVIREGDEGDYYYVIESGRAQVSRVVGGVTVTLADLKSGDAFGEEALVSEAKRNATVTMKLNGMLLRLAKQDFIALLKEPLLSKLSAAQAREKVAAGAQWLDVRYPSEYQYDRLPGALNVPLAEVRNAFSVLDKSREYVIYCQSGRRSSAAAFLLAHRGFRVFLLDGGLWAARQGPGG